MQLFTLIFGSIFIIVTFLPIIKTGVWWIRIFDYPRIQIAAFLSVSIILAYIYWGWNNYVGLLLITSLLVALIYQLGLIFKYTPLHPIQARKASHKDFKNTIRIMESNIRMENTETEKLLRLVKDISPNVLIINEANEWWSEQLIELDKLFPYSLKKPLENTYGMLLFSEYPLKNTEINFLVEDDIPSFFATVVLPSSIEVDIHCLHPKPPMPGTPTYERDTEILLVGKRAKKSSHPTIVVGDLNDVAWSYTSALFQRYSGLLDPRQGRGLFNTYNVATPLFRYPLDHFFYSAHFGLVRLERLPDIGSDHFPMMLELCYEEDRDHAKNKALADSSDKAEVEEKIEDGKSYVGGER
jgi:endonuclease/exonuclease/phosphatase (EEP) superfamily protein YafD